MPYPMRSVPLIDRTASADDGSLTPTATCAARVSSVPKNTKTFLPTLTTDSPHGWSSQASGSERAWARRVALTRSEVFDMAGIMADGSLPLNAHLAAAQPPAE